MHNWANRWTQAEIELLRDLAKTKTKQEIADHLGRSWGGVNLKLHQLHIRAVEANRHPYIKPAKPIEQIREAARERMRLLRERRKHEHR